MVPYYDDRVARRGERRKVKFLDLQIEFSPRDANFYASCQVGRPNYLEFSFGGGYELERQRRIHGNQKRQSCGLDA